MSVHEGGGTDSNGSRSGRSAVGLVAVVLFVGGIVSVVVGVIMLVTSVIDMASDDGARRDAIAEIALPGEESVDLGSGSYVVLALGRGLVSASYDQVSERVDAVRGPFAAPLVEVTGPDGVRLELGTPRVDTLEDRPGTDAASLVEFTVRDAGAHTIVVAPAPDSTGGPVESVIVRDSSGLDAFGIGDLVPGFVLTFAGGSALMVGVLLGVLSLVRRKI